MLDKIDSCKKVREVYYQMEMEVAGDEEKGERREEQVL